MLTFFYLLILLELGAMFPVLIAYIRNWYDEPVRVSCIIFCILTVVNTGISVFITHVTRPDSLAGTYTIEKAVPEMNISLLKLHILLHSWIPGIKISMGIIGARTTQ